MIAADIIRCDGCGRFMNPQDLGASSLFIPDSDYSREEGGWHCRTCTEKHGAPVPSQSFMAPLR